MLKFIFNYSTIITITDIKCERQFLEMIKLPVKKLFFCSVAAALLCLAAHRIGLLLYQTFYFDVLPAYESPAGVEWEAGCPLHTHEETNAPVLLNAHTGLAAELRIFEPHRTVANEISEQDEYGFMRSDYGPGYRVRAFPDERRAVVRVERAALYQYSGEAAEAFSVIPACPLLRS